MAGRGRDVMDDLIDELTLAGFTAVFEPSLDHDLPIVLVTVKRGEASYVARGPNSWKAAQRAVSQMPQSDDIFNAIN